jgi:hypothetical protein
VFLIPRSRDPAIHNPSSLPPIAPLPVLSNYYSPTLLIRATHGSPTTRYANPLLTENEYCLNNPTPIAVEAVDATIWPWGTTTLRRRLAEPRFRQEGARGPVNPFEEGNEPIDPHVIRSALDRTLQAQLAELTSYRTEGEGEAFRVRDFSWMGVAYSSHPRDALELRVGCDTGGFVDHLRKKVGFMGGFLEGVVSSVQLLMDWMICVCGRGRKGFGGGGKLMCRRSPRAR